MKTKQVQFRVDEKTHKLLKRVAKSHGISISEAVRISLFEGFASMTERLEKKK